jgi:UrcA family protein
MSKPARRAALFAAAAFTLIAGAALAQPRSIPEKDLPQSGLPLQPPPEGATVGEVIIEAPKIVERSRLGIVSAEVSMSVRVPYGDLDMRSADGAAELDRRIKVAADYVCDQLERRYPQGSPETFYCAKEAVRGTRPQVIKARNAP